MFFAVVLAFFIVGMPALWLWVWRVASSQKNRTGMQLEVHSKQTLRAVKNMLPVWLTMILMEVDNYIHTVSVSPHSDTRLIWFGFFSAALLFIIGWNIVNVTALVRQEREKRRQQLKQPSS